MRWARDLHLHLAFFENSQNEGFEKAWILPFGDSAQSSFSLPRPSNPSTCPPALPSASCPSLSSEWTQCLSCVTLGDPGRQDAGPPLRERAAEREDSAGLESSRGKAGGWRGCGSPPREGSELGTREEAAGEGWGRKCSGRGSGPGLEQGGGSRAAGGGAEQGPGPGGGVGVGQGEEDAVSQTHPLCHLL